MPDRDIVRRIAANAASRACMIPADSGSMDFLTREEVLMIIQIGKEFDVSVDKTMALEIFTTCCTYNSKRKLFTDVSDVLLDTVINIGYPITIPAKMAIVMASVEAIIETDGNLVYDYFEKNCGQFA